MEADRPSWLLVFWWQPCIVSILLTHASSTNQGHGGGDHEVRGSVIDRGCIARSINFLEHTLLSKSCKVRMYECLNQRASWTGKVYFRILSRQNRSYRRSRKMITLTNHQNGFVHFHAGALQLSVTCIIHGPPLSSDFTLTP